MSNSNIGVGWNGTWSNVYLRTNIIYMLEIRHLLKIDWTSCFKCVSHSKFNWEDLSNHLMSIEIFNTVTS
jgi:hypothetical protein